MIEGLDPVAALSIGGILLGGAVGMLLGRVRRVEKAIELERRSRRIDDATRPPRPVGPPNEIIGRHR